MSTLSTSDMTFFCVDLKDQKNMESGKYKAFLEILLDCKVI